MADYDSATGIISFERSPAKFSYDYITGFENILMDVTIYAESSNYNNDDDNNNSIDDQNETESEFTQNGGGGCNSGLNILCAILCLALINLNRKR